MILEPTALALATAGLIPMLLYVMWSDAATMRIPNAASLMIFLVFIPTGLMGLPLEVFGWRILHTVIAFFVGFGLFQISGGRVGGGDLKLIIALTPYVNFNTLGWILVLWSGITLVSLGAFMLARYVLKGESFGMASLEKHPVPGSARPYFPAGVSIGLSFIVYFVMLLTGHI